MDEEGREQEEERRSDSKERYASDYQPVSDAVETNKEEEEEERVKGGHRDRGRLNLGCKDDRHQKRIDGGARGEANKEGQFVPVVELVKGPAGTHTHTHIYLLSFSCVC